MRYLDQLKKISKVPHGEPKEPKKPPETGSLGFLGAPPGLLEKIDAGEPANEPTRKAWRWLVHFENRTPLEVAFSPEATHGEVLDFYPDALAAEPIEAGGQEPGTIMAGERTGDDPDDRRFCSQCLNLRGAVCSVAKPGGLVSAIAGYRPALPELPRRCAGYSPNADDPDQRPGRERWPGFTPRGTRHADY